MKIYGPLGKGPKIKKCTNMVFDQILIHTSFCSVNLAIFIENRNNKTIVQVRREGGSVNHIFALFDLWTLPLVHV